MMGRRSPMERSLDFSNSSSFSSVSASSESPSLVDQLHILHGTNSTQESPPPQQQQYVPSILRLPTRRIVLADTISTIGTDDSHAEEPPSPLAIASPAAFSRTQTTSEEEGVDGDPLRSTAARPASAHCFLSATRDSASPPAMSSYFCAEAEGEAGPFPPVWAAASFEEIITPRSLVHDGPLHASPLISPIHAHHASPSAREGSGSVTSLPTETVPVNAAHAQDVHVRLHAFSAAIMAGYQLVKLKVRQRLYRIYYDKWLWMATQPHAQVPPVRRVSQVTQTSPVLLRSVSVGTDFADIDSYHASRSASAANTPRVWGVSALTSPLLKNTYTTEQDSSPPPRSVDGGTNRGGTASALVDAERHLQSLPTPPRTTVSAAAAAAATSCRARSLVTELVRGAAWSPSLPSTPWHSPSTSPSPEVRPAHAWTPSPAQPLAEGIAARTRPSRLVDFGRPSDAPRRKAVHVANPVVAEPMVVPSPERVYRR